MPVLSCYVSDRAYAALERFSEAHGRSVESLAEAAIEEAALRSDTGMSREMAEARIASLRRDQAWQTRWMAGGADERAEWSRLTRIAGGDR